MIIGIDENNFSPSIAGDCAVTAYATKKKIRGVKDSKQLSHEKRLELFAKLQDTGIYVVTLASVSDINRIGIYEARNFSIEAAASTLIKKLIYHGIKGGEIIIDGKFSKEWINFYDYSLHGWSVSAMINGDEKIYEISAASIIGKVYIDSLFQGFGAFYPGYDLEKCHGSPSKTMYAKLRESGPTPYHRTNYGLGWWEKIMKGERRDK